MSIGARISLAWSLLLPSNVTVSVSQCCGDAWYWSEHGQKCYVGIKNIKVKYFSTRFHDIGRVDENFSDVYTVMLKTIVTKTNQA